MGPVRPKYDILFSVTVNMKVAGALCMNHGALPHCPVESAHERPQLLVPRQARHPHIYGYYGYCYCLLLLIHWYHYGLYNIDSPLAPSHGNTMNHGLVRERCITGRCRIRNTPFEAYSERRAMSFLPWRLSVHFSMYSFIYNNASERRHMATP